MRGKRPALWTGCAAFALALLGCGSITPLEGADGGGPPPEVTAPDTGIVSVLTRDAAAPAAGGTKDAGPLPKAKDAGPPPMTSGAGGAPPGSGGAPGPGGSGGATQGCSSEGDCSDGLVCNVATGACVECLVDADCKGKTNLCDLTRLTCLQCASDGDCGGG